MSQIACYQVTEITKKEFLQEIKIMKDNTPYYDKKKYDYLIKSLGTIQFTRLEATDLS